MEPLRVLHCPTATGGNAWTLSRAERSLGVQSDVMVLSSSWLEYPTDIDLRFEERSKFGKGVALGSFLASAATKYDVFHFNFGSSILEALPPWLRSLRQVDLPLLRSLGKGIVVTYQGCDVRRCTVCATECPQAGASSAAIDEDREHRAAVFDKYAHSIFALNPDLLHALPARARFLPYTTIDPRDWTPVVRPRKAGDPLVIVHSPTSRTIKGTRFVIEAVEAVSRRFPNVTLRLVEGLAHEKARALYESADLVIDQLLIGWYGGFAVEAMALGKPVVCYMRAEDLGFIPADMRAQMPIINASPSDLFDVLCGLVEAPERLSEIGARSRKYVERWHAPLKIARQTTAVYEAAVQGRGWRSVVCGI